MLLNSRPIPSQLLPPVPASAGVTPEPGAVLRDVMQRAWDSPVSSAGSWEQDPAALALCPAASSILTLQLYGGSHPALPAPGCHGGSAQE